MDPPLIIHLHIPKNAGTTLSRMVKLRLLLHPPTRVLRHDRVLGFYTIRRGQGTWQRRLERIESLPERARRRVRFFEAHCGFGVDERLPRPSAYMTLLRDPVDRALSVFDFRVQQGRLDPETPVRDWFGREPDQPVWHVDNGQVRFLAGEGGQIAGCPIGGCTRAMLDRACERLERADVLAGTVERFDEYVLLLEHRLGLGPLRYARSNVTRRRRRVEELSRADADFLREATVLDRELVERAAAVHARRVQAALEADPEGLDRIRARSAAYARRFGWFNARMQGVRRAVQRLGIGRS